MKTTLEILSPFVPIFFYLLSFLMPIESSFSPFHTHHQSQCLDDQKSALMQLQQGLYYAPNFTISSKAELWGLNNAIDCCSWKGISCDAFGHVVGLDLSYNNLSGSFHSIFDLHHLQYLNLAGNNFINTTLLQYGFGFERLPNLTHLNLSNSCFHGQIPVEMSSLTRLVSLDLSSQDSCYFRYYQILDPYPYFFYSYQYNYPLPYEVQQPLKLKNPNLKTLIKKLRSLTELYLDSVNISTDSIQWCETISQALPKLHVLSLSNCGLTGPFCSSLSKLQFLSKLSLSHNPISYLPPNFLEISSRLVSLKISRSKSGPIPNCLGSLTTLSMLELQGNNLTGNLPNFAKAAQLQILKVSDNRLEGRLPPSLAKCSELMVLDVGKNMLYDTFPLWLGKLPSLEVLVLRKNRFYGEIKHLPEHENVFPALDVLDIASNKFSGEVSSLHFLQATQIRTLKINGNRLEGKLPRSLANCSKLEVLDLGNNMLHDTFPYWLDKLPSLKVLVLRANGFHGTIQISGSSESAFPMLHILDIASNNFSGELPVQFFQCLRAMMQIMIDGNNAKPNYIGEDYYQDSVTIVNKGFEIFYEKILTIFACLDVSNNNFHGRIPQEVKYLKSLQVLNLSHNSFSGPIPPGMENLTELESLDLSQNNLSGKIPPQLNSLTFLAKLNLSLNQLDGIIPRGNQFDTFENDSYYGNSRLCGLPLTRKCNEVVGVPTMPPPSPREDVDSWADAISVWKIALIGYAGGLVVGLCLGYTVLNELGNKWLDCFNTKGRRNRRRRTR
ncbi:hypothetical protein COLO4_13385 [Corchorus olitorius]|uniref:Leucine-rich repeat-containing N-terminal plant-type domain-containing protein n=1 Tax=Corchorus olitorius TaxID=93759 RepID=A0A1R3JWP2_9ROSI|nr:hypothetical protein COLO4_13385 [Corchorus olitorius]